MSFLRIGTGVIKHDPTETHSCILALIFPSLLASHYEFQSLPTLEHTGAPENIIWRQVIDVEAV